MRNVKGKEFWIWKSRSGLRDIISELKCNGEWKLIKWNKWRIIEDLILI
jgi:hypothetical protein